MACCGKACLDRNSPYSYSRSSVVKRSLDKPCCHVQGEYINIVQLHMEYYISLVLPHKLACLCSNYNRVIRFTCGSERHVKNHFGNTPKRSYMRQSIGWKAFMRRLHAHKSMAVLAICASCATCVRLRRDRFSDHNRPALEAVMRMTDRRSSLSSLAHR